MIFKTIWNTSKSSKILSSVVEIGKKTLQLQSMWVIAKKVGNICYAQINNSTNKIFPDEVMQFIFHWLGPFSIMDALQWRHNGHDGVSSHQPHHCLFNRLFRRRSMKTPRHIKYIQNMRIYADWSKYNFRFLWLHISNCICCQQYHRLLFHWDLVTHSCQTKYRKYVNWSTNINALAFRMLWLFQHWISDSVTYQCDNDMMIIYIYIYNCLLIISTQAVIYTYVYTYGIRAV